MRKPTKFRSKRGIEKGNKEWEKVSRGDPKAHTRGKGLSNLRGIPRSIQEVSRVLKGRLLICYGCGMGDHLWKAYPLQGVE